MLSNRGVEPDEIDMRKNSSDVCEVDHFLLLLFRATGSLSLSDR